MTSWSRKNVWLNHLRSSLLPDDACDEGGDEEDEEDGGEDHDDADARALVEVRHQARPLDRLGPHRVVIIVTWRVVRCRHTSVMVSRPVQRLLRMREPVTDSWQGSSNLHLGGHQPPTEGVCVCTRILHHPLHHCHCLSGILKQIKCVNIKFQFNWKRSLSPTLSSINLQSCLTCYKTNIF